MGLADVMGVTQEWAMLTCRDYTGMGLVDVVGVTQDWAMLT